MSKIIITFGKKYKDQELTNELINDDKQYFKWAFSELNLIENEEEKKFIENWLLTNDHTEFIVPFGKHKNRSLNYIRRTDFKYLIFLDNLFKTFTDDEKFKELRIEISKILNKKIEK
jgi:hypothetical protein